MGDFWLLVMEALVDVSNLRASRYWEVTLFLGLDYNSLAYTIQHGFAAVASNNGHNGTNGLSFYQNPDVVEDFAGRS
jgi:hypothetical protein